MTVQISQRAVRPLSAGRKIRGSHLMDPRRWADVANGFYGNFNGSAFFGFKLQKTPEVFILLPASFASKHAKGIICSALACQH